VRQRLPKRIWHAVHLSSYEVYLASSVHFLTAGSEAPLYAMAIIGIPVAFLVALVRVLVGVRPRD
jgi:DMSO/TMAO reductase YedYZ heme-binding membrane subunit